MEADTAAVGTTKAKKEASQTMWTMVVQIKCIIDSDNLVLIFFNGNCTVYFQKIGYEVVIRKVKVKKVKIKGGMWVDTRYIFYFDSIDLSYQFVPVHQLFFLTIIVGHRGYRSSSGSDGGGSDEDGNSGRNGNNSLMNNF